MDLGHLNRALRIRRKRSFPQDATGFCRAASNPRPISCCVSRPVPEERPTPQTLSGARRSHRPSRYTAVVQPSRMNCRHQFACLDTRRGEAHNFVVLFADQHLHKASRFRNRDGSEHIRYRQFRDAIFDFVASVSLRPTRASSGSVNMQNGTMRCFVLRSPPFKAVTYDAEVMVSDVWKLRTARAIAHRHTLDTVVSSWSFILM